MKYDGIMIKAQDNVARPSVSWNCFPLSAGSEIVMVIPNLIAVMRYCPWKRSILI